MNGATISAAQLLGRFLMAVIFIRGGFNKIMDMDGFVATLIHYGVPSPEIMYYLVVAVELLGGIALVLGFRTRAAALVMALYCVLTAVIAHWHPGNEGQLINYFKNLCMAGGFLQLYAVGGGAWSLDAKLTR